METAKELRPCPFCGSKDLYLHEQLSKDKTITWFTIHHGVTTPCGVTLLDTDKDKLISLWNASQLMLKDKRQTLEAYEEYRQQQRPNGTFGKNNKELIDGFLKIKL